MRKWKSCLLLAVGMSAALSTAAMASQDKSDMVTVEVKECKGGAVDAAYDVYDENENPKYFVKAEFFSLGHQLHVYDRNNHELGVIRQRLLTFLPAFEIEIGGRVRGEIRKQFSFFKPRYEIDYNGWRVEGDFLGWDYDVYNGCSSIIHISKELFHWGDTYTINFSDPQDELEGLMLVIAIDAANCTQNNG